ncbi:DNA polymerase III subunit chi [Pseudohalocynthiibacter aestuariivivens]|nr:DNA polymerase III subunit chi [Pseudohalocynthiibacter aestuariivivens]QIE44334.1 DNA polymerase III subunit chi [Pseudohalocynthiibacter aestuariivivens]
MGAAYFYHLTRRPLETALPMLVGKARQASWRVAVRGATQARMEWLDEKLWQGADDGFPAHGLATAPHAVDQPVLLTTSDDIPNGAVCLMTVDGAQVSVDEVSALSRVCILFDGNDPAAVDVARGQWKMLTDAGCAAQYWSEESGRWEMKAEKTAASV